LFYLLPFTALLPLSIEAPYVRPRGEQRQALCHSCVTEQSSLFGQYYPKKKDIFPY
jgi:hypothetical protein